MYKIAIVAGGNSLESEISVISALKVANLMSVYDRQYIFIYQNKDGEFYRYSKTPDIKSFAMWIPTKRGTFITKKRNCYYVEGHKKFSFDIVLPVVHGKGVEDGTLKGYFDTLGIPVVSSGLLSSSLLQDKAMFKSWCKSMKIPTISYYHLNKSDYHSDIKVKRGYGFPLVIKPNSLGSSIGISKVNDEEGFKRGLDEAFKYDTKVIIEKFCPGLEEYNIALVGNKGKILTSEIERVNSSEEILTFEDKYIKNTRHQIVRDISSELKEEITCIAKLVYNELSLVGSVRFDFMYSTVQERLYLNEVNTIPGSLALDLFERSRVSKLRVLEMIIDSGVSRIKEVSGLVRDYKLSTFERLVGTSKLK